MGGAGTAAILAAGRLACFTTLFAGVAVLAGIKPGNLDVSCTAVKPRDRPALDNPEEPVAVFSASDRSTLKLDLRSRRRESQRQRVQS